MDSLQKLLTGCGILILVIFALSGCTKKDNLTGTNWSNVVPQSLADSTGINLGFSFPADTLLAISSGHSKLLVGNFRGGTAVAYMRFTGMPDLEDSDYSFEHPDSCYLKIKLLKSSLLPRNPLTVKLYKTNQAWTDTLASIEDNLLTPIVGSQLVITNEIPVAGTVVRIPLSYESLRDWKCAADTLGYNIAIKMEDAGFVEISSSETIYTPVLNFRYKKISDTEYSSYTANNAKPVSDSYTLNAPEAVGSTVWKIDNLSPTRLYVNFEPDYTLYKDVQGNTLSPLALKQVTINQAKLVLYPKPNTYYTGATNCNLFPLNVKKTGITGLTDILKDDCERMLQSTSSGGILGDDSLEIDITPIIQAYTSGERVPLGIVILSQHERQNFEFIEFWDFSSATPSNKKPFVRVVYTPPFLQ